MGSEMCIRDRRELGAAHLEGSVLEMEVMDEVRRLTGIRFGD